MNKRRSQIKSICIALALLCLFIQSTPADCICTVTFSAIVNETVGLFGSPSASLTTAPGQVGANIVEDNDAPADPAAPFAATVNFGNLSHGDGSNTVARIGLRARGDTACHISCSVSTFTASNVRFERQNVTSLTDMTMANIGTEPIAVGANGNASTHSYDPFWSTGTNTLANMNGGVVSAVDSAKQKVCSFSDAPSASGNLTSPDNYVESHVTVSLPTGFKWSAAPGTGQGTFSATLQFEIYTGA